MYEQIYIYIYDIEIPNRQDLQETLRIIEQNNVNKNSK